jgi:hypothetical protein
VGYTLEAVIGAPDVLQPIVDRWPDAMIVPLASGLALVPMTDELFDAATDGTTQDAPGFFKLPTGFDRELAGWSAAGPVAYVEAEFFGGVGSQCAALWEGGRLTLGPMAADEDGPISQVLARLGVSRDGQRDEFDTVGLDRHRHTEDWLPERPR